MAVFEEGFTPTGGVSRKSNFVNFAGAALSLALIAGVGFWGYKLIMRDVSGIPVVRAMKGDMRVLPDNPGGDVALHTGLSVNQVAASGEAGAPEDTLLLAPSSPALPVEDVNVQPTAEAAEVAPVETAQISEAALRPAPEQSAVPEELDAAAILALADQIAAAAGDPIEVTSDTVEPDAAVVTKIAASVPGVSRSLRPVLRPAGFAVVPSEQVPETTQPAVKEPVVSEQTFPSGTHLVQLGAFPNPALAESEWARLTGRFGELLGEQSKVIQVSDHSGSTWYRLRASGFEDRAAARRLCAALTAEGAACIPVTVD